MLQRILHSKTKTVSFAAFILAISALLSRFLGILRNNFLGNMFPTEQVDVYLASFKIPDLVYGILITGGITAAFLPVFSHYFHKDKAEAKELTRNVFTIFVLALALFSFLLMLLTPYLVKLVVPGFSAQQQQATEQIMRIMFLSPILLGASAIISSVLQYFNFFLAYSLAPIFYNLGILFGIVFLTKPLGLAGLAWGVVVGAVAHFLIQLLAFFKTGLTLKPSFNVRHPGLIKIFKMMAPRSIGSAGYYLNLVIITGLASLLPTGAITAFNFANDLYGVPMGLIGISFATAVFPALSKSFAANQEKRFLSDFSRSFSNILFFAIPASFLMFLLRAQVVRLLYGTQILGSGYFGWDLTRLTGACVGILTISIFASCLIPFLARVFYALKDTQTPVKISLLSIGVNLGMAFYLSYVLRADNFLSRGLAAFLKLKNSEAVVVLCLPIALAVSTILQIFLLYLFLQKKIPNLKLKITCPKCLPMLLSGFIMSAVVYFSLRVFALAFNTTTVGGLLCQTISAGLLGVVLYLFLCWRWRCFKPRLLWRCLKNNL